MFTGGLNNRNLKALFCAHASFCRTFSFSVFSHVVESKYDSLESENDQEINNNHTLQTNPRQRKEETQTTNSHKTT